MTNRLALIVTALLVGHVLNSEAAGEITPKTHGEVEKPIVKGDGLRFSKVGGIYHGTDGVLVSALVSPGQPGLHFYWIPNYDKSGNYAYRIYGGMAQQTAGLKILSLSNQILDPRIPTGFVPIHLNENELLVGPRKFLRRSNENTEGRLAELTQYLNSSYQIVDPNPEYRNYSAFFDGRNYLIISFRYGDRTESHKLCRVFIGNKDSVTEYRAEYDSTTKLIQLPELGLILGGGFGNRVGRDFSVSGGDGRYIGILEGNVPGPLIIYRRSELPGLLPGPKVLGRSLLASSQFRDLRPSSKFEVSASLTLQTFKSNSEAQSRPRWISGFEFLGLIPAVPQADLPEFQLYPLIKNAVRTPPELRTPLDSLFGITTEKPENNRSLLADARMYAQRIAHHPKGESEAIRLQLDTSNSRELKAAPQAVTAETPEREKKSELGALLLFQKWNQINPKLAALLMLPDSAPEKSIALAYFNSAGPDFFVKFKPALRAHGVLTQQTSDLLLSIFHDGPPTLTQDYSNIFDRAKMAFVLEMVLGFAINHRDSELLTKLSFLLAGEYVHPKFTNLKVISRRQTLEPEVLAYFKFVPEILAGLLSEDFLIFENYQLREQIAEMIFPADVFGRDGRSSRIQSFIAENSRSARMNRYLANSCEAPFLRLK